MLNMKVVSLSLGTFAAVSFVVCVLWGLLLPEALHMHGFLELVLPGFSSGFTPVAYTCLFETFFPGALKRKIQRRISGSTG